MAALRLERPAPYGRTASLSKASWETTSDSRCKAGIRWRVLDARVVGVHEGVAQVYVADTAFLEALEAATKDAVLRYAHAWFGQTLDAAAVDACFCPSLQPDAPWMSVTWPIVRPPEWRWDGRVLPSHDAWQARQQTEDDADWRVDVGLRLDGIVFKAGKCGLAWSLERVDTLHAQTSGVDADAEDVRGWWSARVCSWEAEADRALGALDAQRSAWDAWKTSVRQQWADVEALPRGSVPWVHALDALEKRLEDAPTPADGHTVIK